MGNENWNFIGNKKVIALLDNQIKSELLAHTYIFLGSTGLGKTTLAKKMIRRVTESTDLNSHPDVSILSRSEEKKEIGIEDARIIIKKTQSTPLKGDKIALIIDDAHKLSLSAANALLKTLEEPKTNLLTILVVDDDSSIPATIRSRAQVIKLLPSSRRELFEYLTNTKKISRDKANIISHAALGIPARVVEWSENDEAWQSFYTQLEGIISTIKLTPNRRMMDIKNKDEYAIEKVETNSLIIQSILRDIILIKKQNFDTISYIEKKKTLQTISDRASVLAWEKALKTTQEITELLSSNCSPRVVYENILLIIP